MTLLLAVTFSTVIHVTSKFTIPSESLCEDIIAQWLAFRWGPWASYGDF